MIRALFFDMDGTLVKQKLDFHQIKKDINVPDNLAILEYLMTLDEPEKKQKKEILEFYEHQSALIAEPNVGFDKLISFIKGNRFKIAVLTRNSRIFAEMTLKKIGFEHNVLFGREDAPFKPNPSAILEAMKLLGVAGDEVLMIGDYKYDIIAGKKAGCWTCFITNGKSEFNSADSDFIVDNLGELPEIFKSM